MSMQAYCKDVDDLKEMNLLVTLKNVNIIMRVITLYHKTCQPYQYWLRYM